MSVEVVGQSEEECDTMVRGRGCETVGRAEGKESEAAGRGEMGLARMLDCIENPQLQNGTSGCLNNISN